MASVISGATSLVSSRAVGAIEAGGVKQALLGTPGRVQLIPKNGNAVLQFDASVSETHTREATPTAFPLEDSRTISDHIVISPFELTLNGFITDTPIGGAQGAYSEALTTGVSAFAGALGVTAAASAFALSGAMKKSPSPSAIAFAQMLKLQAGEPDGTPAKAPPLLDVITSLRRYPNMVIKNITAPRDVSTGKTLRFTMTLTQLTVVRPQTVNVSVFRNGALSSNKGKLGEEESDLQNKYKQGLKQAYTDRGKVAPGGL